MSTLSLLYRNTTERTSGNNSIKGNLCLFLIVPFVIIILCLISGCRKEVKTSSEGIELVEVGRRQASVVWTTQEPLQGRVFYHLATGSQETLTATETLSKSYRHKVQLPNLIPGMRYTYWIDNPEKRYQFQTQPEGNSPFSFLFLSGENKKDVKEPAMSELPDFIIDMGAATGGAEDPFKEIRQYIPVYNKNGAASPFLAKENKASQNTGYWQLNWGGLQLMVMEEPSAVSSIPKTVNASHFGIIMAENPEGIPSASHASVPILSGSDFHNKIKAYNKNHQKQPVVFVVLPAETLWQHQADDISYLGIPYGPGKKDLFPVRFDIDHNSVMAIVMDNRERIVLKAPPLQTKITCDDCRRLADRGAYQAAIKSYQSFIDNNKGHYQIDDAYFAVAEIYDEKLFDFKSAHSWYKNLVTNYSESVLAPLAMQRLKQLEIHSDFEFEPLVRFEKIRKAEFSKRKTSPKN